MSEGEGTNKDWGSGGNRWHGQIVDDSVWRDNILAGKYEDKDSVPGWGRRYKVRVFGEHDLGGEDGYPIPDEQLPWASIEFPVTAGSGAGNCKQTPALRQGNIVSGYWADGYSKQMPVITGVIGNNEQILMGTEFPVPVTESGTSLAVSAFPNKQKKLPDLVARPKPPQDALITKKPSPPASTPPPPPIPSASLDDLGLQSNLPRTPEILADIARATELADARALVGQGFNADQVKELTKFYVQRGLKERRKQAGSPFSITAPGATTEALGEHLKTAQDIGREHKFEEKIVLMTPDDVVESATKAIQTINDNLTKQIKLYTNSLTDYAAATQRPGSDFKKMVKDSACQISKYMKVILQKQQEYTNKKLNTELTDVVAEMPSYMRAQFLDVKEENNKNLVKQFNSITDDMCGLIENILENSLNIKKLEKRAQEIASGSSNAGAGFFDGLPFEVTGSPLGSNDSTTDLSGIPQPYNAGQTYQPLDIILFEGRPYINRIASTGIEPSVFNNNWAKFNGALWGNSEEILPYQNEEQPTYTKVSICNAESLIGQVFNYNKADINGAVLKAVNGMNKYVEDMQSELDAYEKTFVYKAGKGSTKEVIALSDEEGLGDDRGGAGYTSQNNVGTGFRGVIVGTNQGTGGDLTVDITVSRGGPAGRAPEFKDSEFTPTGMAGKSGIGTDYYWITQQSEGDNYSITRSWGGNFPGSQTEDTGILYNCTVSVSSHINDDGSTGPSPTTGIGASVDVYFESNKVKAIRCQQPYSGSVSSNGYSIGDVLTINGAGASSGTANWSGSAPSGATISGAGTGATFMINRKIDDTRPGDKGRLRGPIDDNGINIANGGTNYQVGQVIKVVQVGNPLPASGDPADNIGAPQGGTPGGSGGVDASFTVVGVLDMGDKRAGVGNNPIQDNSPAGFSNMLKSLSSVMGNLTSALDFDNMPVNIFPGEKEPNKALADYYTLGDAGQAAPTQEMPMMGQIMAMANQDTTAAPPIPPIGFALPVNPQDINLRLAAVGKDAQIALENTIAGYKNATNQLMDT